VTRQFIVLVAFVVALTAAAACTDQPAARNAATEEQPVARPAEPPTVPRDGAAPVSLKNDAEVLADFKDRVDRYAALRMKVDNAAPPLKNGDVLTPDIASYFQRLLRPETKDPGTKAAIKDDNPGTIPFKVNGDYPDKEPLSTVPPNVLLTLPRLPDDIEYRFVGKHMILRDVRANLIIDYMTNAIP
jgi:hypothetical protein